uniref:RNA-directed DNA polymerase n=1 Tax=Fagus sylvatica TaxID=28930 RepID=A0A2N9IQQ3_FAGSY
MPSLETFDGSKDPLDHLESFKTVMCLQGVPDEIMCRAFPTTLKGPARVWFKKITPGSVGSFAQLSRLFFNHLIGAQRYGRPTTHLLNIKQKDRETLRSYLTRFNKETLLVDGADDKVVLTAFISGLQAGDFLFSVYKDPPSTMTEMMHEAQRHMNGEEALLARDQTIGKKRKWEHPDCPAESHETRPKAQRNRNRRQEDRSGRGFNERFNHFTPLNAPVDHIFMQIRNDPALKWPGKLLTDPDKRPRDKYCRFHRDHGHNTEDCYDLKRQIEELIKQGKLQRFVERGQRERSSPRDPSTTTSSGSTSATPPLGEIHVITGGVAAGGTSQEDAHKVFHPHDDALVVTLEIVGYSTRRVLIDNGSSADIIYLTAFQQMRIDKNQLRPIETPLVGFTGTSVYSLGIITLQLIAGTYPKQATKKVDFLVVDCPSAYNVIIGRPTLNRLRAVTSTYHLLVRFPTENGIGEMRGDQAMARECYLTSTSTEPPHQALIVEERQNIAEPTEELEEIVLVEGLPNEKEDNMDRDLYDGKGISTKVVAHQLNVNPSIHPVKQKRRVFAPERNAAIMEEVDKLLKAGFIREVYYPEWLANVDSYPLPRIDQLVDSTAGHKLLSFMDAFSGYNQIQMAEEDQEKTAFITSRGLFCYKVMPFGLKNAGATYQRLVNKMFHDQIGRNVEVYADDMLVKSKKDDNHLADLKETFQGIKKSVPCEEERVQKPVYYTSRALRGAEERYTNMEKLAFALLIASRKLRPYFQAHSIIVMTDYPIRKAMNKPDAAGRLIQWSIEMGEFDIDYRPRTAIKAQALADFIAEFTHQLKEDEQSEEGKAWTMNIDGSSTKEMSGAGVVLVSPEKDKFKYALQLRFRATNNEAEYEALLVGLKLSKSMGIKTLTIKSDSQLIVGQAKGEYEAKEDRMKKYLTTVKALLTYFEKVELLQIPREDNVAADRLARLASSGIEIDGFIEIQGRPSTEEEIVNSITINTTWMSPIIRYLREGTLPADRTEAHKLRIRASHFRLLGGILYKMGFSRPHLRCLSPEEANYVIREVHEGICGNHSKGKGTTGGNHAHNLTLALRTMGTRHHGTLGNNFRKECQEFPSGRPSSVDSGFHIHKLMVKSKLQTGPYSSRLRPGLKGQRVCGWKSFQAYCGHIATTVRTPTKETPFKLTFGTEAVIPVEIGLTTFRTAFHREEENEGQLRLNLDLLVGDWVLRKVTQATKDPSQGKLGPNWEGPYKVTQYYRRGTYHLEDRHGKKLPHP